MKRWLKRTLIGVFGASVLFGGLAACSHRHHHHNWQSMSEEDAAKMRARMIDRVAGRLDLDDAQKAKLGVVADQLRAGRQALRGSTDPRTEVQSLVAGNTFDRAKAKRADRAEDQHGAEQEPGADRRVRRLLRQPQARAAAEGA